MEEALVDEKDRASKKAAVTEAKAAKLKELKGIGANTRLEMDSLAMKLKMIVSNLNNLHQEEVAKRKILRDLREGVAKISTLNDYKAKKANLSTLSGQFLHGGTNKKVNETKSNADKLIALDKKIVTLKDAMSRKATTHAKEMKRLMREHKVLEKVSSYQVFP